MYFIVQTFTTPIPGSPRVYSAGGTSAGGTSAKEYDSETENAAVAPVARVAEGDTRLNRFSRI